MAVKIQFQVTAVDNSTPPIPVVTLTVVKPQPTNSGLWTDLANDPSGTMQLIINGPNVAGQFVVGQYYDVQLNMVPSSQVTVDDQDPSPSGIINHL